MDDFTFWSLLSLLHSLTVAGIVLYILRRPWQPRSMMAWILAILLMPVLGIVLFLMLGEPRKARHRKRRRKRKRKLQVLRRRKDLEFPRAPSESAPPSTSHEEVRRLAKRLGASPATSGNDVTLYFEADATFMAIQYELESAAQHIHMEYFIFNADETGRRIRDLLLRRAREGLEVRLLLDYLGCWHVSRRFWQPLRDAGVHIAFALPVIPWRGRWWANFRNHRKIVVCDGCVGFTGSQNIGNEYLGRYVNMPDWRDTHLRVEGPAATDLQSIFIEDWHYTTGEDLLEERYLPHVPAKGKDTVQLLATGPTDRLHPMHQMLIATLASAKKSIRIITPYFVPDEPMLMALQAAALRGRLVQLIIPSCSNHPIALWAGRSFYSQLLQAGVEIFEHNDVMLHSKITVLDDEWGTVGSANMDERSFRINFEVTTLLYSPRLAEELIHDFEALRENSRQVRSQEYKRLGFAESLKLGLARLASPML